MAMLRAKIKQGANPCVVLNGISIPVDDLSIIYKTKNQLSNKACNPPTARITMTFEVYGLEIQPIPLPWDDDEVKP